jgi:hypothetical protein
MLAVVCLLDTPDAPEGVFLFSTSESVACFMLKVIKDLRACACATDVNSEKLDDEIIECFQLSLRAGEYFHQFEVTDLRTTDDSQG